MPTPSLGAIALGTDVLNTVVEAGNAAQQFGQDPVGNTIYGVKGAIQSKIEEIKDKIDGWKWLVSSNPEAVIESAKLYFDDLVKKETAEAEKDPGAYAFRKARDLYVTLATNLFGSGESTATKTTRVADKLDDAAELGNKVEDTVHPTKRNDATKIAPNTSSIVDDVGRPPSRLYGDDGTAIPYGFKNVEEYKSFSSSLKNDLPTGTDILFQGSSVTGKSYKTGTPFDAGRLSDYDIALAGNSLFQQAKELGYKVKDGTRIGPLNEKQLEKLGLLPVAEKVSEKAGRPVNFMLFDSTGSAYRRPSIIVF